MKEKRSKKESAENYYQFNERIEKDIYAYVCLKHRRKRSIKKMDTSLKFGTYTEWNKYVKNKYQDFSNEKLNDFSHFLNLKIRNVVPESEYLRLLSSVFIALLMEKGIDIALEAMSSEANSFEAMAIKMMGLVVMGIILGIAVLEILQPLFKTSEARNFYTDYKEIIDNMIDYKRNADQTELS